MKKLLASLAIVTLTALSAHAQVSGVVNEDGFIEITGNGEEAAGIDLISAGGFLVPIPGNDATPFTFLLSNTADQITWGSLGSTVTLDGTLVTGASYTGTDPLVDLTASWGDGADPVAFPVAPVIPEPTAGLLAVFAALGMMGFRGRRN